MAETKTTFRSVTTRNKQSQDVQDAMPEQEASVPGSNPGVKMNITDGDFELLFNCMMKLKNLLVKRINPILVSNPVYRY